MSAVSTDHAITDHGAVGDAQTNNAWAIQRAIDACASGGGGKVVVPPGTFLTGKIFLRSNIELHLEAGATLLCSPHFEDILGEVQGRGFRSGFLCADGAANISLTGAGTIDGNGRSYVQERLPEIYVMKRARPRTVVFIGCPRVTISGITVRDAAEWTIWLCGCSVVTIDQLRIENDRLTPNSDGLDIDHCQDVRITNCHLEAGDDTIALKTTRGYESFGPCENIVVSGCELRSSSSAFVVGCEIASPVRNVVVDACTVIASHRGLAINHSFESDVEDIRFSNITVETRLFNDRWWGAGEPIYVKALPWEENAPVGCIRNVVFENIKARGENGIVIWGERPDRISGVALRNVQLTVDRWTPYPGSRLDLRPLRGPDNGFHAGVIAHPTCGLLLHNAVRVSLNQVDVTLGKALTDTGRQALVVENVSGLETSGFSHREL